MTTTRKRDLENAALSGLPIDGRDVVRVSRTGRCVTYRHAWAEDCDARIWHGVSQAAREIARDVARRTGRSVAIYASGGWIVDQIEATS